MFDYNFSTEIANEPDIHRSGRNGQNNSSYNTYEIYKRSRVN